MAETWTGAGERVPRQHETAALVDVDQEEADLDPELGSETSIDLAPETVQPLVDTAAADQPESKTVWG